MRKFIVGAVFLVLVALVLLWAVPDTVAPIAPNPLASTRDAVIEKDTRNAGIDIDLRYAGLMERERLVVDLRGIAATSSRLDVFRVLLQSADALKATKFETVELRFRGEPRFRLDGAYFRRLGEEYGTQNPMYTARTFPSHVKTLSGDATFPTWEGGLLGVLSKEMEDFGAFHDRWYLTALLGR